ncbi:hypothetical protein [Adlercreutzia caecimuris]|uniref:hypothetical protein n=1 Tax=Adlercreutzia caecimuris TaxID=671266 RepID=UPI00259126CC|nr:hypothetical protein [Adlercreutzia caecimuris]
MTLRDALEVLRHYLNVAVLVLLAFVVAAAGCFFVSSDFRNPYTASSSVTVSDPTGVLSVTGVKGLFDSVARDEISATGYDPELILLSVDESGQELVFSIQGPSSSEVLELANGLADSTAEVAVQALRDIAVDYEQGVAESELMIGEGPSDLASGVSAADRIAALGSIYVSVTNASMAEDGMVKGFLKYCLVGVLGGAVVALLVVAFLDLVRRPIRNSEEVVDIAHIPLLASTDSLNFVEQLLVSVRLSTSKQVKSVCFLPLDADGSAIDALWDALCSTGLHGVSGRNGSSEDRPAELQLGDLTAIVCPPVSRCAASMEVANECDATVLVLRLWSDGVDGLRKTVSKLEVARANLQGFVLVR